MLNILKQKLDRDLLKYTAGRLIQCPRCAAILDYRTIVLYESPLGVNGACCSVCWQKALDFIHDDKPHAYLISIGWKINTLAKFDKVKTVKPTFPQNPGKVLDTFLRKDIAKGHKKNFATAKDRAFPSIVHSAGLPLTQNEDCQWSNPIITVPENLNRLHHLSEAIRLERLWDQIEGSDNCPARKKLEPLIKYHRKIYDFLTLEFINDGVLNNDRQ